MVTKSTRMQSRRTNTAGKVFTASELLEGEIGINMPDKKMWFKDASGNVQRIAGGGRAVDDFLQYENFLGSGFQGVGVKDRLWVRRDADGLGEYATLWVTRSVEAAATGTDEGVSSTIRVDNTINKAINSYEWGLTVNSVYDIGASAPGSGQHVSIYGRAEKKSHGAIWANCFELRDFTTNPTQSSVGSEITLGVTGTDNNDSRFGLHVSLYSADNNPGTNEVSAGIVVGGPLAYVRAKRGIKLGGAMQYGIDFTELDMTFADRAMLLKTNQYIEWGDSFSGTKRGSIHWNSTYGTFAYGGVNTYTGAVNGPLAYKVEVINGSEWLTPMYQRA